MPRFTRKSLAAAFVEEQERLSRVGLHSTALAYCCPPWTLGRRRFTVPERPLEGHDDALITRVAGLLFEHDPMELRDGNPDLPGDEYDYEAEEILRRLRQRTGDQGEVVAAVTSVFAAAGGGVRRERLRRAGVELHAMLRAKRR